MEKPCDCGVCAECNYAQHHDLDYEDAADLRARLAAETARREEVERERDAEHDTARQQWARAVNAEAALVSLLHVILGCDGVPCRVEGDPVKHAADAVKIVEQMQSENMEAAEHAGDADALRRLSEGEADIVNPVADKVHRLVGASVLYDGQQHRDWTVGYAREVVAHTLRAAAEAAQKGPTT